MSARESAHRRIDDLPEEALEAVERFFEYLVSLEPVERTELLRRKRTLATEMRLPPQGDGANRRNDAK